MKFLYLITISMLFNSAYSKELVVYSSRKEHLVKDIFKAYEKESGVKISYRTGKAGALIEALKIEGANVNADLLMTVDAGNLWYAASQDLFTSLNSSILNKNVPKHLRDKDGKWFGLSIRARTIVYNKTKVKPKEMSTYSNLANKNWKGRLCLRTSKKVYNQSLVAMLIHDLGYEKAKKVVKGWVDNAVDIFSNDTAVVKAVSSGQCDLGIVNTYYFGRYKMKHRDSPVELFWPDQNGKGVHVNVSGAGVLKYSKNIKEAKKFLEWLSSDKAQKSFAQVNLEYAINNSVEEDAIVKQWGIFRANTTFPLTEAGKLQKNAIRLFKEVGYK